MPAKATAAAQRPREEIMHPLILQRLAAEHVKDQLATADDARHARHARQARCARRSRASRQRTRLSLPGTQAGLERRSATITAAAVRPPTEPTLGLTVQVEARIQTPGRMSAPAETENLHHHPERH
jgi:hypothetical protein